jgi:hypothetical protein
MFNITKINQFNRILTNRLKLPPDPFPKGKQAETVLPINENRGEVHETATK